MIFNLIDEDGGPNAEVERHYRRHSVYLVNTSHKRMGTNRYNRYSRHSPMSAEFVRVFASPKSLCQSSMFRFANLSTKSLIKTDVVIGVRLCFTVFRKTKMFYGIN